MGSVTFSGLGSKEFKDVQHFFFRAIQHCSVMLKSIALISMPNYQHKTISASFFQLVGGHNQ